MTKDRENKQSFEELSQEDRTSFSAELWFFLKNNKKWWLLPILVVLALLTGLAILGGSALAPFIYPLF